MSFNQIKICISGNEFDRTVLFAAEELKRYLHMMMPNAGNIILKNNAKEGICLGLLSKFGLPYDNINPEFDDILDIDVQIVNGVPQGIISGSNPRSVLAAVYRYLHENGCRWPRPGVDGELIPLKDITTVKYRHLASYRHRGLCIEGAVSYQNMMENIDWAPKVGYNAYMFEFMFPYAFFENWYDHRQNRVLIPERVSPDDVHQRCAWLESEITKRGMEYHSVGHAWTCEPFGIPGLSWGVSPKSIPEDKKEFFAEIDGKREFYQGKPLNTNLCYSNPETRKKVVDFCADYAERNSHINYLHFWLADDSNNHCECAKCINEVPADQYLTLLNEIDAEFTRREIRMRIVFIVFVDLLWPPKKIKFNNPDRFSLLFAPITRIYSRSYETEPYQGQLPEYKRNQLIFPKSTTENIAYLREWQKIFNGDSFCYEYYFWRPQVSDPGYYDIARTILEDIKALKKLGLNGIVSDQSQRVFIPTGFPMYVMGQGLYDSDVSLDTLAMDFFATYGNDGELCKNYMTELSYLFDLKYLRAEGINKNDSGQSVYVSKEAAQKLMKISSVINKFREVIKRNLSSEIRCVAKSWQYLNFHADLCERMADVYLARAEGNNEKAKALWERTHTWLSSKELEVQEAFDLFLYSRVVQTSLGYNSITLF